MIIREAISVDIPAIAGFQLKMTMETEKVVLDESILHRGLLHLFSNAGLGKYYVAEENGELAGCLMTTFEWSEWRNGTILWIQSVYVAGQFRGQGVYKSLYQHIQQLVSADPSLRGIRLYADKTNFDAQRVYTRLGMNGDHYQVYEWIKN